MWAWARRVAMVAFLAVLMILWLVAPTSGSPALALASALLTAVYVVGAVVATVLMTGWVWRHRELVIVSGMVASRYHTWPLLCSHRSEGEVEYLSWSMPVGVTVTQLTKWREVFEQALNLSVDWWYQDGKFWMRTVRGSVPARVDFGEFYAEGAPAGELVFGVGMGRTGRVWADLASLPHLLIGGVTGGGKSVFLRQLVTRLVLANPPERLRVGFIDLKGGMEMNVFGRLPHRLSRVLREWQECGELLEELNADLDRRQAAFEAAGVVSLREWNERHPEAVLPYLVLVIDETAELTAVESPDRAERASRQAQLANLIRICRLGRAAGIHAICATQRPDAEAVPGQLKANLPSTMAFRVRDAVNSRVLLGDGNPQAASLPPVPGRGLWQTDGLAEVQSPWLDRDEVAGLLEAAYPAGPGGTERVSRCPISAGDEPCAAGGRPAVSDLALENGEREAARAC
jgi:S-DNA-T family DNA segregation ATPase FtsK/SpoIIIE